MDLVFNVFLVLFGGFELAHGVRTSRLSGFGFFGLAGGARNLALWGLLAARLLASGPDGWGWGLAAFGVYSAAYVWQSQQEARARREWAEDWAAWEQRAGRASAVQKVLFFWGVEGR